MSERHLLFEVRVSVDSSTEEDKFLISSETGPELTAVHELLQALQRAKDSQEVVYVEIDPIWDR